MNGVDNSQLTGFLKEREYRLKILEFPFDTKAETIEPLLSNIDRKVFVFSPGLKPIYADLTEMYPAISLSLVNTIENEPSSAQNAVTLINEGKVAGPSILIAGHSERNFLSKSLVQDDDHEIDTFYWHSAADEAVLADWLKGRTGKVSVFFLSTDVPVNILETVTATISVSTLYHDLQDTEFLKNAGEIGYDNAVFLGRNYNKVLLSSLEGILSTQAAENGAKP